MVVSEGINLERCEISGQSSLLDNNSTTSEQDWNRRVKVEIRSASFVQKEGAEGVVRVYDPDDQQTLVQMQTKRSKRLTII